MPPSEDHQREDDQPIASSSPQTAADRPVTATAVTEHLTATSSDSGLDTCNLVSDHGNNLVIQGGSAEKSAVMVKTANSPSSDIGDDGKVVSEETLLPVGSIEENREVTGPKSDLDLLPGSDNVLKSGADVDLLGFEATIPESVAIDFSPHVFTHGVSHDSPGAGASCATASNERIVSSENDHPVELFEITTNHDVQTHNILPDEDSVPCCKLDAPEESAFATDDVNLITEREPFRSPSGESNVLLPADHVFVANVVNDIIARNDGTAIAEKLVESKNEIILNEPVPELERNPTVTALLERDAENVGITENKLTALAERTDNGSPNRNVLGDVMSELGDDRHERIKEKDACQKPGEVVPAEKADIEQPSVGDHVDQLEGEICQPGDSFVNNLPKEESIQQASTEEEAEWLSMGLGLSDALKQIVALTVERDAALAMCQEKEEQSYTTAQSEALLLEVQSRLQAEMVRRAESDSEVRRLREELQKYEDQLMRYSTLEDEHEKIQANLVMVVSEKSKLEAEVVKLREFKDESEQQVVLLSNRLNEAKKKEANKSTEAGRLEAENEKLKEDLERTISELDAMSKAKSKIESNMEKLKAKAVERVKQAETALAEERELNEERKKKMKSFVESKADELREAKESVSDMQIELQETRTSLRSSREREESLQKELEKSQIKYRELHRDMERLKRSQEEMHKMGSTLEHELEKSASETEEHKKKRMSAKHELMTMVRTLEVEKSVSGKLRESIKFTFTPKALSQQQLLHECLKDFEVELERLAIKLGKALVLPPQSGEPAVNDSSDNASTAESQDVNGTAKKFKKNSRVTKADSDTERLISNLEHETQHVSKGIMSLAGSIERMRSLLDENHSFNCMSYFSNVLAAAAGHGEARHQRLGNNAGNDDRDETVSITSFDQGSSTL